MTTKIETNNTTETENDTSKHPSVLTTKQVLLKATGLALLFFTCLMVLTALVVGIFFYSKVHQFFQASGLDYAQVKAFVDEGLNTQPEQTNGVTTFLVLGLDTVANKADAPPLTDTMMLLSINYQTGKINTLSLPRDLWSSEYQTKINSLYYYGLERYPNNPEQFPVEVISELTNVPINYTVIVSLDALAELVTIVDGVEVEIPDSFTDEEFPRSDVDVQATTDPALLYETVTFEKGTELMTADRVLKYIRSRHAEGDTGTDINRSQRQQLVISALIKKLKTKEIILNPTKLAELYKWYERYGKPYLSEPETVSVLNAIYPQRENLELISHSLTIYPDDDQGVIYHPPLVKTNNQWSYIVRNDERFSAEIYDKLGLQ